MVDHAQPTDALFELDGERLVPGMLTQGPWNPTHQHGGAVSGILAHLIESYDSLVPMRIARLTVELLRGVPIEPLRARVIEVRNGKKLQVVQASLIHNGREVARGTGLKIRISDEPNPVEPLKSQHADDAVPPRRGGIPLTGENHIEGFELPGFVKAVEIVRILSEAGEGAPAGAWTRLRCRIVDQVDPSPFVRLAALGDFTSGLAQYLPYDEWMTINPDLTIQTWRDPIGEWVGFRSLSNNSPDGIGMSEAVLYDETGRIGRGLAATLITPR